MYNKLKYSDSNLNIKEMREYVYGQLEYLNMSSLCHKISYYGKSSDESGLK